MNPRRLRLQDIEKPKHKVYLEKASDFHEAMMDSYETKNWSSVGLTAVHCVISAADALLCGKAGLRLVADDHMDLIDALAQHLKTPGVEENRKRAARVIAVKNLVEYEARQFRKQDAERVLKDADRFFLWAKEQL